MFITTMNFEPYEECRISDTIYVYIEKVNKKSMNIKITETDGLQITNQIVKKVAIKPFINEMNKPHISFNFEGHRIRIEKNYSTEERIYYLQQQISNNNEKLKEFYGL